MHTHTLCYWTAADIDCVIDSKIHTNIQRRCMSLPTWLNARQSASNQQLIIHDWTHNVVVSIKGWYFVQFITLLKASRYTEEDETQEWTQVHLFIHLQQIFPNVPAFLFCFVYHLLYMFFKFYPSFWPTVLSVEPMVQYVVCLSVCLSVVRRLSVTFCVVAKWCVLAKKCLKEWIGNQGQKVHFRGRHHISTSGFAATATKTAVFALFLLV